MRPGEHLRQIVQQGAIQVPGAPSALMGRLIEHAGFRAAYVSGAALSASSLALPDVGLFSLTELVQHTAQLTGRLKIPVIVDADTGFGDTLNVERTVQELERAGAAAIQLEDQQLPKRCGHLSGKHLIDADQMCGKLRAAAHARHDPQQVLIARTDARGVSGLEDAIRRSEQYVKSGADWIFPEALASRDEFAQFARRIDAPLVANMTEFGKSPLLTFQELRELGYAVVLYPVTLLRVAMHAAETALGELQQSGSQHRLLDQMQTRLQLYDLLDYHDFDQRERAYFGETHAANDPNTQEITESDND